MHGSGPANRRAARSAARLLRALERAVPRYGESAAEHKRELLRELERQKLPDAGSLLRLHESIAFLRAYPDDEPTARLAERLARGFARRPDLAARADELADSGIAGTAIHYAFYWATARWLARRWPRRLAIEWDGFEGQAGLEAWLPLLATPGEGPALDEFAFAPREWLERMRSRGESDAACLVRLFERIEADDFWREKLFETLDTPFRLAPGPGGPSRTLARHPASRTHYRREPLSRERPDLRRALGGPPPRVRAVSVAEGRKLVELAREAMVTRSRDLDVFANGDPRDVRLVDFGDGLQFACIGLRPERRLLLETVYGFLTLNNGVPIGYVLTAALFGSAEVAYNVFETYRGAEAGKVYARVLLMARHLFGAESFSIDPYQLGHHNDEGLASGAWWFYYKFGFRPLDPGVRRLVRAELRRMKADPRHRSSRDTLRRLVAAPLFWHRGLERADVMGRFPLGAVGLAVTRYLARRFGGERRTGLRRCAREAGELLGVGSMRSFTPAEREAWRRWSPLVLLLPGVAGWTARQKQALVAVVRAKGGRRESEYVRRFDAHAALRRAVAALGRTRE